MKQSETHQYKQTQDDVKESINQSIFVYS